MPLRVVGALLIVFSLALVAMVVSGDKLSVEIAQLPMRWSLPVSRQLFLERSRFYELYVLGCAAIAASAGIGMLLRRWWPLPLYGAILAALLLATFSPLTQFLAPPDFRFKNPDSVDVLLGSIAGLLAALGFWFRPRGKSTSNNRWRGP